MLMHDEDFMNIPSLDEYAKRHGGLSFLDYAMWLGERIFIFILIGIVVFLSLGWMYSAILATAGLAFLIIRYRIIQKRIQPRGN